MPKIEIIKRDLDALVKNALETGKTDDLEVIGEIVIRYPDAVFIRHDKNRTKEFSAQRIGLALDYDVEIRPV